MKFMALRLHAPMQAWGEVATGESRPTRLTPTKSGVLGLMACALGIGRNDQAAQRRIADGYGLAVRTDRQGVPVEDFHTVGMAEISDRDRVFVRTRADETAHPKYAVKYLTRRGYLADAAFTALLWQRAGAPYPLKEVAAALENPRWPLFLGRRSCPPAPLSPRLIEAETLAGAFRDCLALVGMPEIQGVDCPVQWDADDEVAPGVIMDIKQTRIRDSAINRRRWMFSERAVMNGRLYVPAENSA